jgi:hypothetical protein
MGTTSVPAISSDKIAGSDIFHQHAVIEALMKEKNSSADIYGQLFHGYGCQQCQKVGEMH